MEKHVGVIAIIVHDRKGGAPKVNDTLSQFGDIIIGRIGIPYHARNMYVVTVVVDGTTDQIGSLSGKLGQIPDVTVKCTMAKCDCQ